MPPIEPVTDPLLSRMVARLVEAFHPLRIYLFGSHARGEPGPDSDYDLMVVLPDDAPAAHQRWGAGREALRGIGTAVDVLLWTRARFDGRAHLRASLSATILREGKLLHES